MTTADWGSIYKELGARPVINATGSVTMLGGSTPAPEVREAMDRADGAYIPLMELEERAGEAIAKMVNVPAAYITSGAGSALTLANAACMAGDGADKLHQLPNTTGMTTAILSQARQRETHAACPVPARRSQRGHKVFNKERTRSRMSSHGLIRSRYSRS